MTKRFLDDKEYAVGLTWLAPSVLTPSSSKYKIFRELQSIKPTPFGYVHIDTPSGLQIGAVTESEDIGCESAAAKLATSRLSAVLIEQLSTDEFWLCAVEDGAIFPAGDIVGNKDLIANRLEEIKTDIAGTNIQLYDKHGHFDLSNSESLGFLELVSESTSDNLPICLSAEQKILNKKLIAAVIGSLMVIGGLASWPYLSEIIRNDEADSLTKQRHYAKALNDEKESVRQTLMQNAPALLASMTDMVKEQPLRVNGWRRHSYDWRDGQVSVNWRRERGYFAAITAYFGDRTYELNESTGDIAERFSFPAQELSGDSSLELLLGKENQRYELLDTLATLPGEWTLSPAKPMGQLYKYQTSKLTGSSSKLTDAVFVANAFIGQPFRINRISYSLDRKFNWEIQGEFYGKQN
ncbi:MAG: type 4b pilus protein PilO2 [Acidiferrobacterales bacterium]|nr:type 4b pilus protein PilO2 [Acidiferrobacterales bacterium]